MSVTTHESERQIEVRHASFGYGDRVIVEDASLTMGAGEVVALLGPNGCGKSTLVRGILGLVPLLRGEVALFGMPLAEVSERTLLGYVPQRHTLAASVRSTVREIVATGRLPHRPWWRPASTRDRQLVTAAIEAVGLGDRADHEVSTLSGGQQRRVLIARALAGQPALLVMDEPTAGVDRASQEVLAQVIAGLVARGASMLVVTHELEALAPIVTRVILMDEGRITFDGSLADHQRLHRPVAEPGEAAHHEAGPAGGPPPVGLLGPDPLPAARRQ